MEPFRDRLFFAGEAAHETLWGTVGGAWESGERAADAVLRRLAGIADPEVKKPEPVARPRQPQRQPRQKQQPRRQRDQRRY
jgi:ADP-ribose pyrophosphatase YjhB (NUDIX family)